jgi:preprotein translocase subunit SecY
VLIFAGIVAELPRAVAGVLELGRQGQFNILEIVGLFAMVLAVIVLIVFMERAQRRIPVQYPRRQVGQNQISQGQMSHLPLKLNTAGVIPPIFASSLLLLPTTLIGFAGASGGGDILSAISTYLRHGQPLYMVLYGALIAFFCFFYTAIVFNPKENADMLKKYGGFVPGMRPGQQTAEYLDFVLTRLTVIGAVYIIFICLLPELLISKFSMPFYFGGTSLLIVVSVTMDTVSQIHSHLVAHQYEGLIRKSRLRGKR